MNNEPSSASSAALCIENVECIDEDVDEVIGSVSMPDCDNIDGIMKQRVLHSAALLKKELKMSAASLDMFFKVCISTIHEYCVGSRSVCLCVCTVLTLTSESRDLKILVR